MALDVFLEEMDHWSWDRFGRIGPKFRLKANSAGLSTEGKRAAEGGVESGVSGNDAEGVEGAGLCVADGGVVCAVGG